MKFLNIVKEYKRRKSKFNKNVSKIQLNQVNLDGEAYDLFIDEEQQSVMFVSRLDGTQILSLKNNTLRKRSVMIKTEDNQPASKSFRAVQEAYDLITELKIDDLV